MKAYRMTALGHAHLVDDAPEPTAQPGEVLVAPETAGVCGTDIHVLHEGVYLDLDKDFPFTMGHEVVGQVVEVARRPEGGWFSPYGDRALQVGDHVVAEPVINCGHCAECLAGLPNLCSCWTHLGIGRNGVWAERVAIPARRLTRIDPAVPREHAVLAEPLACALHFLSRANVRPGDRLVILGGGPAGQLTLLAARAAGVGAVGLSDPIAFRRELAGSLGADFVIDPTSDNVAEVVLEQTGGRGADVVIEIAGTPQAVSTAAALPHKGGTLLLAGICGAPSVNFDTNRVVEAEIDVRGAFATRGQMAASVAMLERGLPVARIVSKTRSWHEAGEAINDLATDPQLCKVALVFD